MVLTYTTSSTGADKIAKPGAFSPPDSIPDAVDDCGKGGGKRLSLAFTTYQAGKLFLIGLNPAARLSIFNRTFSRCMGLWGDGQTLYPSTLFQL
jgi:hypothetical protein